MKLLDKITEKALREYNFDNKTNVKNTKGNKEFVDRIVVNYIRHSMTSYDTLNNKLDNYREVNKKVYAVIAKKFPELAVECRKQYARKFKKIF